MKTIMIFLPTIYFLIAVPDTHAGIASVITYLQGECNEPDEKKVQLCSDRKTGDIYYVYQGERYEEYPVK